MQQLLYDGARRTPDRPAFHWVDRDRTLTYGEAVEAMERVAGALASLGVERGDRVGVFAHNGMDYLLAMFGAWRLGAIAALVNVQYADRLDYYVNDCSPKVLVYTGTHQEAIDHHRSQLQSIRQYVCMDGPAEGALSWAELLESAPAPPPDRTEETDVAHLSYTSGTTGDPKGACLAHEPTMRATRCIAERLRIQASDVSLGPTALSSSYHLVANLLPGLHRGAEVCVLSTWEPERGWDALEGLGATILAANPTFLRDTLDVSRQRGRPPGNLRIGLSGGAPVPVELKLAWRDELGVPLAESFGMSELGGFVGLGSPDPVVEEKAPACGQPLPDKEVRILDDDGREVPVGTVGEICVRGGYMVGYWERSEKTAETLRGGWLHTGDVGYVDAEQFVFVRGRLAERLRVSGEYWYPRDVEEAVMRHSGVREAALIGLPDPELGDRPVVYVTLREGPVGSAEVVKFAEAELGRDLPGLSVEAVDAMPMTPTGKISKAQLKAQAGAQVATPSGPA
ncbi:MAG: class I adenylate-forming enzyme family protein [Actinomycetota bacterium]